MKCRRTPASLASWTIGTLNRDARTSGRDGRGHPEAPEVRRGKLLLVQPVTLEDTPRGVALLAVDAVGAGVNDKVLVVIEAALPPRRLAAGAPRSMRPSSASLTMDIDDRGVRLQPDNG